MALSHGKLRVGVCAAALALAGLACQGEDFFGREPFDVCISWGEEVTYLGLTQSARELSVVVVGILAPGIFFGAALRGLDFGDAFLGRSDQEIVRSFFTLSRNGHIEDMSVLYEPVFARETTLSGRFAVMEEYIEETSQGLVLRGYSVAFGNRRVCFFLQISTREDDFPRARDALDRILAGVTLETSYPAIADQLPSSIELDGEQFPLVMSGIAASPPSATVSWEGNGLSLHAMAREVMSTSAATLLSDVLGRMAADALGGGESWSTSVYSIDGLRVDLQIKEVEGNDGAWTQAIVAWSDGPRAFLVEYKRFTYDYRSDQITQIVRAFRLAS